MAAALALLGSHAAASGTRAAPAIPARKPIQSCPLGTFHCNLLPPSYATCRPNAMLDFYDPELGTDPSLRGTSPTHVRARKVDSSNRSVYHLSGDVRMQRADELLQADTIDYNQNSTEYDAQGNVRYQDSGQLFSAAHLRGNNNASRGTADDVRYQLLTNRGNGVAEQGKMLDAQHTNYTRATYSTCDVGHHVWEFRAKSITLNKQTGVGVAHSATMRLGNVPFLYLPYIRFPIDDRRESGFLTPTLGHSSRSGYEVSTPYYLNLAPNYDATLDPRQYSERGTLLDAEFRYLFPGTNGQVNLQYVPNDHGPNSGRENTQDTTRYLVHITNSTPLAPGWRLGVNYNDVSDSSYLYDFNSPELFRGPIYSLSSTAAISGSGKWWNASFGALKYVNTNPFAGRSTLPYDQLPFANFSMDLPLSNWLEFSMDTTAASFRKNDAVEGKREDIYPTLQADFGTSAWFVRPQVGFRYTAYQLGDNYQRYGYGGPLAPGQDSPYTSKTPSRALPITSLDSGLVFDRSTTFFGKNYTQTLEPRLFYVYVPYRDQDNLPRFDTSLASFDYYQLFTANQYTGPDRQMNANNLTGALTTRLLDADGVERLSASFGQIRYFSRQRVQLPSGQTTVAPATDWSGSDYVAQLDLQLTERWRLNSTYQWSPNSRHTDVAALDFQHRLDDGGILNFGYHYRRGRLEQYTASAVYPVSDRWKLIGSVSYSAPIQTSFTSPTGVLEALAGIEYDSCCITLRLVDHNFINQTYYGAGKLPAGNRGSLRDNAILFEVVFKGLGSSGGQIDPLLRRDILGYQ